MNLFSQKSPASKFSSRRSRASVASAVRIDSLEARVFFSVSTQTTTIKYHGESVQALKDSYVVASVEGSNFTDLAAAAGFTNVTALGTGGFYSFNSSWSVSKIERWGNSHKRVVEAIGPNMVNNATKVSTDPSYKYQYALQNVGQLNPANEVLASAFTNGDSRQFGTPNADINIGKAWDITTGSKDVVVAVIDSGLDVNHPDLAPNVWVNPGEIANDGIDNDHDGYIDDINGANVYDGTSNLTDTIGHGTAVASCISAVGDNGIGIAGVTWNTKLMTVKVDQPVTEYYLDSAAVAAYDYIVQQKARGVNIVAANLSFGGRPLLLDPIVRAGLRRLSAAGIVAVTAAGNDGQNNDTVLHSPARESSLGPSVLTVAATDNQDKIANFSDFGAKTVDVGAPGVQILMAASADAISDTANTLLPGSLGTDGRIHGYMSADGTSFATPITAGIVALAAAAYPNATAEQLVAAIKAGVDKTAGLSGLTANSPAKVATAGRVDAYNTLRTILNRVGSQVSTLGGDWLSNYGADAAFIFGSTPSSETFPFATGPLVPDGSAITAISKFKVGDTRLLQTADGLDRSTSQLTSPTSIAIPFDFGTTTQRLSMYAVDVANQKLAQNVQIVDTDTGRVLQTVNMTQFQNGRFLTFDLTGKVTLKVAGTTANGAVLNGLFLDSTPTDPNSLVGTNSTIQGNWMNSVGDLGQVLPGNTNTLPFNLTFDPGFSTLASPKASKDVLGLETPTSTTARSNSFFTSDTGTFDISLNSATASARKVSFYVSNPDKTTRAQRISIVDPTTGEVTNSTDVVLTGKSAQYVTFNLTGNNTVRFSSLGGGNPTLNGVFLSSDVANPTTAGNAAGFVASDSTTQGTSRGLFGTQGSFVIGASNFFPSVATSNLGRTTTPENSTTKLITSSTHDVRAPLDPTTNLSNNRVVGYLQTTSSYDVDVDLGAGGSSRLSAYFVDFDKKNRVEKVEIVDADTDQVLSSQTLRNFSGGKYLTWDVTGNVKLRVTRVAGPNAVLSAIYFD